MNRQNMIRGALLLAAVAAVYFAPEPDSGVVAPTAKASSPQPAMPRPEVASAKPPGGGAEVLAIRPRLSSDEEQEPFVQVAWEKPAPPSSAVKVKVKEEPPPPPQAPPLPFKVLGQYSERGEVGVFLLHNDKNLVVRIGDTIAEQYKVESLKNGVMTLVYLPLQQQQTLVVSAPN